MVGDAQVGVAQRAVAVYTEYRGAQGTVALLADAGFPVERTTVVGSSLEVRARRRGRLSTADATARGGVSGLIVGTLVGWLLALFGLMTPEISALWLAVNAAILGAALGATVALSGYALTRGRRWFTYPPDIRAQRYDVLVDADVADDAVRIPLAGSSARQPDNAK